jgi:peptidoglycan/xylan/chitin deacetylase (PgdA/CDA1 family)
MIGERAERFPELVRDILRRGHQVGHHTHTHPARSFWCATPRQVNAELDDALAVFARAGARPCWFRCPAGIKNLLLGPALAARGLRCVGWSVRSFDTCSRDPAAVRDRIMRRIRPGSIVLLHEGPGLDPRVRVKALALVLDALAARRLTCALPLAAQLR